jgi:hypothetical protein
MRTDKDKRLEGVQESGFKVQGSGFKVQGSSFGLWSLAPGYWLSKAHGVENIKTNIVFYFLTLCVMPAVC